MHIPSNPILVRQGACVKLFFLFAADLTFHYPMPMLLRFLASLFFTFSLLPVLQGAPLDIVVRAEEAILMNARTGQVLFEKNGYRPAFPASTTKIATAITVLHYSSNQLDDLLTAEREAIASIAPQVKKQSNYRNPPYWLETDATHMGIKKGEQLSLHDLLKGMLIASANDAANVIAQNLGGTIPKFMDKINAYLKEIGCQQTHFLNPHGLHHPDHISTAYDLALMTRVGLKNPLFRQIVATPRCICPQSNLEPERILIQGNHLLRNGIHFYPKAIGVKTGYTQAAGKNLVAAASSQDRELIAVALGYRGLKSELYQDITKMFEAAFTEQKMRRILLQKGIQKFTVAVKGGRGSLKTYLLDHLCYDFYLSEQADIKLSVSWNTPPLPITENTPVGHIRILNEEGDVLNEAILLASQTLYPTYWCQIQAGVYHYRFYLLFTTFFITISLYLLSHFRRKSPHRRY